MHIARNAFAGNLAGLGKSFAVVSFWAVAVYLLACAVFRNKMQKDVR